MLCETKIAPILLLSLEFDDVKMTLSNQKMDSFCPKPPPPGLVWIQPFVICVQVSPSSRDKLVLYALEDVYKGSITYRTTSKKTHPSDHYKC